MEKLFKLKENGTTVRTEIVAGITTFLAMAYILAVNPNILSAAGMPNDAIFAATAISAAFATLIMAFFANYPVVLASGMGLNAYFAFSVVPQLAEQGITDPWRVALTAILFEGVIFIILSIFTSSERPLSTRFPRTSSSASRQVSVCLSRSSDSRAPTSPLTIPRRSSRSATSVHRRSFSRFSDCSSSRLCGTSRSRALS